MESSSSGGGSGAARARLRAATAALKQLQAQPWRASLTRQQRLRELEQDLENALQLVELLQDIEDDLDECCDQDNPSVDKACAR